MADKKTAEQWKQTATELKKKLDTLNKEFSDINSNIQESSDIVADAENSYQRASNNLVNLLASGANTEDLQKARAQVAETRSYLNSSKDNLAAYNNLKSQYNQQVNQLNSNILAAEQQIQKAESSPTGTTSNTSPANSNPGNNTDASTTDTSQLPTQSATPVTDTGVAQTFAVDPRPVPQSRANEDQNTTDADTTTRSISTATPVTDTGVAQTFAVDPRPVPQSRAIDDQNTTDTDAPTRSLSTPPVTDTGVAQTFAVDPRPVPQSRAIDDQNTTAAGATTRSLSTPPVTDTGVAQTLAVEPRPAPQSRANEDQNTTAAGATTRSLSAPPATVTDTEFGDLEGAIKLQQTINQNTSGLPIISSDGSQLPNLLRNPETGEAYTPVSSLDALKVNSNASSNKSQTSTTVATPKESVDDWRFRISLADSANYFYKIAEDADLLHPLKATNGVIYPYTPTIQVSYVANYDSVDLTHSNYRSYNYKNSAVDNISITGDFTAQDSTEAAYLLAVMHFFKCATKMFYGKDTNPKAGTPPPLCYLTGHGAYTFDKHPVVITGFTINYPNDVDYISTRNDVNYSLPTYNKPVISKPSRLDRLLKSGLDKGGTAAPEEVASNKTQTSNRPLTRVPSKIQLSITALPIVTRNNISNNFSLKDYATGSLLRGSINKIGGIW